MGFTLSRLDKILMIFAINGSIITLFVGLGMLDILEKDEDAQFHFFLLVPMISWLFFIPFIGRTTEKQFPMWKLILIVLGIKAGVVFLLEFMNVIYSTDVFFPGKGDFETLLIYAENFIQGESTSIILPIGSVEIYYPPGTGFIAIFLSIINPWENAAVYRIQILLFEAG
ncbi:hypothetical protein GF325_09135, partial [Candidatus Bathyarchaeota archaeon]|nr:hypothetical protein [Candidatus Bathyarchaeota archaeon]